MDDSYLATYLCDHMAGSAAALELMERFAESHSGTAPGDFAARLRREVAAERDQMESLMGRLGINVSRTRKAVAWVSEKFARLKLSLDDSTSGPLHALEVWEALSLGIEGKRLLYRSLAAAAGDRPDLAGVDYDALARQSEEQREGVELFRIEAAVSAVTGGA